MLNVCIGWMFVLSKLQSRFWTCGGQSTVHHYVKNCIHCQIRSAKPCTQLMAPLPRERVSVGVRMYNAISCNFFDHTMLFSVERILKSGVVFLPVLQLTQFFLEIC